MQDPDCREKVQLREADYERIRSDLRRFVILPGHELPDLETVIERNEGWAIVEKVARYNSPRSRRSTRAATADGSAPQEARAARPGAAAALTLRKGTVPAESKASSTGCARDKTSPDRNWPEQIMRR